MGDVAKYRSPGRLLIAEPEIAPSGSLIRGTLLTDLRPNSIATISLMYVDSNGNVQGNHQTSSVMAPPGQEIVVPLGATIIAVRDENNFPVLISPDIFTVRGFLSGDMSGASSSNNPTNGLLTQAVQRPNTQNLDFYGSVTGGSFWLVYGGLTSVVLSFSASASVAATALRTLTTAYDIGVTGSGGPLPTNPIIFNFDNHGADSPNAFPIFPVGIISNLTGPTGMSYRVISTFTSGSGIQITNHDPNRNATDGAFCIAKKIENEWNPIYLGCSG